MNNFYCNYLSGNYMENNLLYLITLMLNEEINKLEDINQVEDFLDNSKCGFLLEELQKLPDIQIFFQNVLIKIVERIERTCSFREIKFNSKKRIEQLIKLKEEEERKNKNDSKIKQKEFYSDTINREEIEPSINFSRDENSEKCKKLNDIFAKKYVPNLDLKEFEEFIQKAKNEKKLSLYEYYNKFSNIIQKSNDIYLYSNKLLMKNMLETDFPTYLLTFYQNDFFDVISFLEQLIEYLMNKIILVPNSIKYICKIISILIRKKFKNIIKSEENAFISKFLLGKLLIPIFSLPSFNALINDFIISNNTIKNIKIICFVLKKLFLGKLFENNINESDYTPFNWFFLNNMDNILLFFDKITNTNLPDFIQKFLDNELPENYSYQYFEENKEQIYANISICFNINNLLCLLKGIKDCNYFFQNKNPKMNKIIQSFNRINSEENINQIKEVDIKLIKSYKEKLKKIDKFKDKSILQIEIKNYYLYNNQEIEKGYEKLFSINNKNGNFFIDIKNEKKKKNLNEKEKNLIKVKNYIINTLANYRLLKKSDFEIDSSSDLIKILRQIKSYMSLPNFIVNNNTIPSVWYINSLLDYLNKIPDDYRDNDYEKLFEELTQNLNDSIRELDFEKLILFRNKLKFLDKMKNYYENVKLLVDNISINENIKNFVEKVSVPVDFIFNYDNNFKKFELTKSNIKEKFFADKSIYEDSKKNIISFKTIEAFTTYFPNLAKYQLLQGINPFNIIKELSINKKINEYFRIIKEKIKTLAFKNEKMKILYEEKIKDYIMNKIYRKIYPPEPDEKDSKIFKKSIQLSWVEPQYFVTKDYLYDNLLPDILNEFNQINKAKTPYKKYSSILKIIDYIKCLIKFNESLNKEDIGPDDITPLLNYIFIKAHPFRIFTDLEFIKIFFEEGENIYELKQMESIYTLLLNYSSNTFNLTPEEYNKRCIDAANNNKIIYDKFDKYNV